MRLESGSTHQPANQLTRHHLDRIDVAFCRRDSCQANIRDTRIQSASHGFSHGSQNCYSNLQFVPLLLHAIIHLNSSMIRNDFINLRYYPEQTTTNHFQRLHACISLMHSILVTDIPNPQRSNEANCRARTLLSADVTVLKNRAVSKSNIRYLNATLFF